MLINASKNTLPSIFYSELQLSLKSKINVSLGTHYRLFIIDMV